MTGIELILISTLINYGVIVLTTPEPEPICSVKTYITFEHKSTEVQMPMSCNALGL